MQKETVIGIDIGGTNTDYAIVDRKGVCLQKGRLGTDKYEDVILFVDVLAKNLKSLINNLDKTTVVKSIGIGAPNGNYFTGAIEFAPNLKWKGIIHLAALIKERMNLPVVLTNDANAAALGEMIYGAAKGMKDFILITLGTGLGSGIVVNGNLLYGHDGYAGELGHTIAVPDGRACGCGKKGCLETYASSTGITRTVYEMLQQSNKPSILRNFKNKLTSEDVFLAAKKGDNIALEAFEYTGKILGMKLSDAVAFSSPEAIILFGGLSLAGNFIFSPTKKYMEYYLLPIYKNKVKLLPSLLNNENAAVLGASALAWEHVNKDIY